MSLLDANAKTVTISVNGQDEEFPKLSYADKAAILRRALRQRKDAERVALAMDGITGDDALPHLAELDRAYKGDQAYVDYYNDGGSVDVFLFILAKRDPALSGDALMEAGTKIPNWSDIAMKCSNLEPRKEPKKEDGGDDPLSKGEESPAGESGQTKPTDLPSDGPTTATP